MAQLQVPGPTLLALRRARELEHELLSLRGALTDTSALAKSKLTKQEHVANLPSGVVLFRPAMAEPA